MNAIGWCDETKTQTRERNPNWRGGRHVASNGYVKIRVGVNHHLADVSGYAYEHRVIAEKSLGRRLLHGEIVHHLNGDKTDNRSENLAVRAGRGEHWLDHRKRTDLRCPGEPNSVVTCLCGCGDTFPRYDASGRPRRYLPDHFPPKGGRPW